MQYQDLSEFNPDVILFLGGGGGGDNRGGGEVWMEMHLNGFDEMS